MLLIPATALVILLLSSITEANPQIPFLGTDAELLEGLTGSEPSLCRFINNERCTDPSVKSQCKKKCSGPVSECGKSPPLSDRIANNPSPLKDLGGTAALYKSQSVLGRDTHICGASLISNRYLITAAHCVAENDRFSISLGREDIDDRNVGSEYGIQNIHIHPNYTHSGHRYNDIALLETDRDVQYSDMIWPYCLPEDTNQELVDYRVVTIAGWGQVDPSFVSSSMIKTAYVDLVKNIRCENIWRQYDRYEDLQRSSYPNGLTSNLLCAGRKGVDACNGDSGGPMSYKNTKGLQTVIGVIARGISTCPDFPIIPGFYTNIAYYIDWIYKTTGIPRPLAPSGSPSQPTGPPPRPITVRHPPRPIISNRTTTTRPNTVYSGLELYTAGKSGDLVVVRNAIASGTPVDWRNPQTDCYFGVCYTGLTALHAAAVSDQPAVVEVLLNAGADKNSKEHQYGDTPLHLASLSGSTSTAATLIRHNANKDAKSNTGHTPLHTAAQFNVKKSAQLLLQSGANKEAKTNLGFTSLHLAAEFNAKETAQLLLQSGANKEAKNNDGYTPLHIAAQQNAKETAQLLLQSGANKEANTNLGDTPLHLAAYFNSPGVVQLLLQSGANTKVRAVVNGETPADTARYQGFLALAATIDNYNSNK